MNSKRLIIIPAILALSINGSLAIAEDDSSNIRRQAMSPEQQGARQEKWNNLTPEQQEALKKRSTSQRQQLEGMTSEQQSAYRAQREQRAQQWPTTTQAQQEA